MEKLTWRLPDKGERDEKMSALTEEVETGNVENLRKLLAEPTTARAAVVERGTGSVHLENLHKAFDKLLKERFGPNADLTGVASML